MMKEWKHIEFLLKSNLVPNKESPTVFSIGLQQKMWKPPHLGFLGLNLPIHISRDSSLNLHFLLKM